MKQDETFLLDQIEHPVFVLELDADGVPRYAAYNRFARNALGLPLKDILGKTAADLYAGRMGQLATERHMSVFASGEVTVHTIVLPLDDGERMIRTVLRPVRGPDGEVTRVVGTSKDATARHTMREVQSHLASRSDDIEQFINFAAHDLRAPMRHVSTLAEMMREDFNDLPPERLELITLLEDVSAKTLSLIGDLLSHAQAGAVRNTPSRFPLAPLVDDIATLLDPFHTCAFNRPDGWITGDHMAFQIVLRNLIDNAMKHAAPRDKPDAQALSVSLSITQETESLVKLCLRDNGTGFETHTLEHLSDGAFTNEGGYGLMAVRRLIVDHGGDIQVANRSDQRGAEITVVLPGQWEAVDEYDTARSIRARG